MKGDQFRCLLLFYLNPRKAASAVLDHGSLLFALLGAGLVAVAIATAAGGTRAAEFSVLMQAEQARVAGALSSSEDPASVYAEFLTIQQNVMRGLNLRYLATGLRNLPILAIVFVPFCIFVLAAWDRLGGAMTVLFRDYLPALIGILFAWTAAHLPIAFLWWTPLATPDAAFYLQLAGLILFLVLTAPVLATVTGAKLLHTAVASLFGIFLSAAVAVFVSRSAGLFYLLASPWLLFYAYRMFGGDIKALGGSFAGRQNFKRQLELATINPHDADAHYQLGLIYLQRRLPEEAETRFRRALEIDPNEPEALFQLGRLLRHQDGRGDEARAYLERGASIDPKLSSHEVWRELGAVALQSGRIEESLQHLSRYTTVREYDPEGLVLYAKALRAAGRSGEAAAALQKAIAAVQGAPKFRRRELNRWERAAWQDLRSLQRD